VQETTLVVPLAAEHWSHHPDGDDLAVALLPGLDEYGPHVKCVESEMLITKADIDRYNIGPGDDVVMVGRFITHDGK
jgi:hypothetical protein